MTMFFIGFLLACSVTGLIFADIYENMLSRLWKTTKTAYCLLETVEKLNGHKCGASEVQDLRESYHQLKGLLND